MRAARHRQPAGNAGQLGADNAGMEPIDVAALELAALVRAITLARPPEVLAFAGRVSVLWPGLALHVGAESRGVARWTFGGRHVAFAPWGAA